MPPFATEVIVRRAGVDIFVMVYLGEQCDHDSEVRLALGEARRAPQ